MHDLTKVFYPTLRRDLTIYLQRKSEWLSATCFFIIVVSLFPLALGPLNKNTVWLVPGIIWVAALLAVLLAQESLWRADYQLGILEQCIISQQPLSIIVLAKIIANWLVTGLPLILIAPLLASSFSLPIATIKILLVSLLLGTPTLSLLGTLGTALTFSLPRGGLLLSILILPLYTPVLVLGAAAAALNLQGISCSGHLALLAAIAIVALFTVPLAISGLIRVSIV